MVPKNSSHAVSLSPTYRPLKAIKMLCQMVANDVSTPPFSATPTSTICAKIFSEGNYISNSILLSNLPARYLAQSPTLFLYRLGDFHETQHEKHVDKGNVIFLIN
jgi:hypothetical protein